MVVGVEIKDELSSSILYPWLYLQEMEYEVYQKPLDNYILFYFVTTLDRANSAIVFPADQNLNDYDNRKKKKKKVRILATL